MQLIKPLSMQLPWYLSSHVAFYGLDDDYYDDDDDDADDDDDCEDDDFDDDGVYV